jgi:hypothetical protein
MNESLPPKTVRELGALLVYFAELAWHGTKRVFATVAPFVQPPEDMEVRCRDGAQYSGVLLIERNDIEAGAVVQTGQEVPGYDTNRHVQRPWSSSSPHDPGARLDPGALGHGRPRRG